MATQELVRGTTNLPLEPEGAKQADELGKNLLRLGWGPVDPIYASALDRTVRTARLIAAHTKSSVTPTKALHPWHLGALEGTPVKDALPLMNYYMEKRPDTPVPGKSPASTEPGEAFNDFRWRALPFLREVMRHWDGKQRIGLVTHFRFLKLTKGWLEAGMPWNFDVDIPEMKKIDNEPGSVHWLHPSLSAKSGWAIDDIKPAEENKQLPAGIYLIRHGRTAWNEGRGTGQSS